MGHGIAPVISRSALTSSPNGLPCPNPSGHPCSDSQRASCPLVPPAGLHVCVSPKDLHWKDGRIPPLPTAPIKEKVAINISVDRDLLAGRARGEGGNGGRSPPQRPISEGGPGRSNDFDTISKKRERECGTL